MAHRKRKAVAVKASAEDAGRKARQRIGGIPRDWDAKEVAEWVQEVSQAIGVEEEAASSLANRFMEEKWDGEALRDLTGCAVQDYNLENTQVRAELDTLWHSLAAGVQSSQSLIGCAKVLPRGWGRGLWARLGSQRDRDSRGRGGRSGQGR